MVALTNERNTKARVGDTRAEPMAATVKVFAGGILMRNAAGFVTKGATATGAAGAAIVRCRSGIFSFANSAAGDAIAQADVGKVCFVVDDQTVAKTNGGATRSPAGILDGPWALSGAGRV